MATILVIGVSAGLVCVRNAVDAEMSEVGNAITHLDQSYRVPGIGKQPVRRYDPVRTTTTPQRLDTFG